MSDSKTDSHFNSLKQPNGPPEFNQKDFSQWKILFGGFLRRFDDAHVVLNTDEPILPSNEKIRKLQELKSTATDAEKEKMRKILAKNKAERDTWRKQNSLAVSHMLSACSGEKNKIALRILTDYITEQDACEGIPKARKMLEFLQHRFNQRDIQVIQSEVTTFNSMCMLNGETGESFVNRLLESKARLTALGRVVDDDIDLLGRLKDGITTNSSYIPLAEAMDCQRDMTWSYAIELLFARDKKLASKSGSTKEQVHYIGGSRWCDNCKKDNHWTKDCFKGKGRQRNGRAYKASQPNAGQAKSKLKCYNCGKMGHKQSDCRSGSKNRSNTGGHGKSKSFHGKTKNEGSRDSQNKPNSFRPSDTRSEESYMITEPLPDVFRLPSLENCHMDRCSPTLIESPTVSYRRRKRRRNQAFNQAVASRPSIIVGDFECPVIQSADSLSVPSGALIDRHMGLTEGTLRSARRHRRRGNHSMCCQIQKYQSCRDRHLPHEKVDHLTKTLPRDRFKVLRDSILQILPEIDYPGDLTKNNEKAPEEDDDLSDLPDLLSCDSDSEIDDDLSDLPSLGGDSSDSDDESYSNSAKDESINMMQARQISGPRLPDGRSQSKNSPGEYFITDHKGKKRKFYSEKIAEAFDPPPHDGRLTILDSGTTSHTLRDQDANYPNAFLPSTQNLTIGTAAAGSGIQAKGRVARVGPILEDVIICENEKLQTSCISIPRLDIQGFTTVFNDRTGRIFDPNGRLVVEAPMIDGLYRFNADELTRINTSFIRSSGPESLNHLGSSHPQRTLSYWHNKLGHRANITLIRLQRQGLLPGVQISPAPSDSEVKAMPLCSQCQIAKHDRHALKYKDSPHHVPRTLQKLNKGQMISTDLKGPFRIKGVENDERYYQGFICMRTHYLWCYFLQSKNTVYENVQVGSTFSHYHADGGSELISTKVYEFLLSSRTVKRETEL